MPRSRAAYAPEFRQKMVELVHAGRSPEELAKEFEPTARRFEIGSPNPKAPAANARSC